jgi:retron-type reverse transcriptase
MVMRKQNRHKLRTISDLARHLGVNEGYLQELWTELDSDETRLYRSWDEPKPLGGTRPIDSPKEKLKFVQRRINERILQRTQINKIVTGGVRGRKLKDNLIVHLGQPMVANFDLKSFFSNITNLQVYRMFTLIGASPDVARMLTRLTTFKGRIPQGGPTSSMLANLVAGYGDMLCLDGRLAGLCGKNKFRLKRWIDDISVSGAPYLKNFEPTIERIINQSGFTPNRNKTTFASKDEAQIVTGHLVNNKPNVREQERRRLRAILHRCKTTGPEGCAQGSIEQLKRRLRGKIAHLSSINPKAGQKLLKEFNSIEWPIL